MSLLDVVQLWVYLFICHVLDSQIVPYFVAFKYYLLYLDHAQGNYLTFAPIFEICK